MRWSVATVFFLLLLTLQSSSLFAQSPCSDPTGKISVNPSDLNFGNVEVGHDSSVLTFKIFNNDPNIGMSVTEINPQNSRFAIVSAPKLPFCINPGSSQTIGVQFSPAQAGLVVSKIRIVSTGGTDFVGTTGTGIDATVNVKAKPGSLDFGNVEVNKDATKSFTIENDGSSTVSISKINSNNNAFDVTSPSFPKNINPGGGLSVNVSFNPNKEGNFNGTLSIIVNSKTVASVAVSGSGKKVGNPDISLSTSNLNFGNLDVGTFKNQTLVISNTGNADLDITFPSDALLMCTPRGSFVIRPGKNTQVNCKFVGDVVGAINRPYTILTNDPDEKKVVFNVVATGQKGPFGFVNRTERSKIGPNPNKTSAVQIVDFDNDKKEDLYLTGFDGNLMCKNTGGSVFINSTNQNKLGNNGSDARGVTWADVD
ncbi:MAG TPA: choice-of-anchor D domain-containing protein, partial [Acidobacteriota bacterium]